MKINIIPALIAVPMNLLIIASIFISSNHNTVVLAIGSVIAVASQLLLLLPFIRKQGYKHKFIIDIKDQHIKNMAYIAFPVIIGISVNQINVLVDRTLASQIVVGGISALNYANRLNDFVQGIFVMPIATVMYPMISKMAAEDNISELKKAISQAIDGINLLVIPVAIGTMIFSEPAVKLLFGRGAFDSNAVAMTANAVFFFSFGMVGFGLRQILARVFFSLQDTKTPMINAAISMVMNIILNIILSKYMGIGGLALATSIAAIFGTVLLFISLRKKIGPFGIKDIGISFIKIICSSLVMGLIAKLLFDYLTSIISHNLSLLAVFTIGTLIYFAIIYYMKIDHVDNIIVAIKKKFKKE